MNEQMQGSFEMERTREVMGKFIGRLGDINLGNVEGIPSTYANYNPEQLNEIAEKSAQSLVEPTDLSCAACIDGRCTLHNADGSPAEIRLRRVGGSASNFGVALNAEASVVDTLDSEAPLGEQIQVIDDFMGERSAHEGGCGGANGEVADNELIATDPAIMNATKVFMEIPEVKEFFGAGFDETLGSRVRENAAKTAEFLKIKGWDGQKYVDGVKAQNPRGVETLEVDHEDEKFHGHKEPSVTIVIGKKTMPLDHDGFVWNLEETKKVAEKFAGQRGEEGYVQVLIADIAKHMAVCKRLPSIEAPILLVAA
jgi:hypothetical protein